MRQKNHLSMLVLTLCLVGTTERCAAQRGSVSTPDAANQPTNLSPAQQTSDPGGDSAVTLFPHSERSRYWVSGQANIVLQWHPWFPSAYSGPNSLRNNAQNATSKVYTLFLGYELTQTTEVFLDIESAGGHGMSDALGLAGEPNLDVVRNPT